MRYLTGLLPFLLAATGLASPVARPAFDPEHTYVFAAGVLEWARKGDWTSFEKNGRRDADLVGHFTKAGVPENHRVYLQDKAATLAGIRTALAALLERIGPKDDLFFYYCGHGFVQKKTTYLANYDAGTKPSSWLPVREVVETLESKFHGRRCMIVIDCCHSGALVEEIQQRKGRVSFGAFTSSSATESSTGNWTFTQAVFDAFSGNPLVDANHDGTITAGELARYAGEELAVFEEQLATSCFTGSFTPDLVLSKTVGVRPEGRAGERIEVRYDKAWWRARVVKAGKKGVKIRWVTIGYDRPDNDEWVPLSTTRPIPLVQHAAGSKVKVKYKKKWFPATVLEVRGSIHHIHYVGYDDEWDEWVPSKRVK
jgi:hypothetical protein